MTFDQWLTWQGRGAMTRVHYATRVSYPTLTAAKRGDPMTPAIARAISDATGGAVSVETLETGSQPAASIPTGTEG